MQDRYAGDIGDLGKFYLLRKLSKAGFTIGVNWYLTLPENNNDGNKRNLAPFAKYDEELVKKLLTVNKENASVEMLEKLKLIDGAEYFQELVELERSDWNKRALKKMKGFKIVFLDPDNGLLCDSVKECTKRSVKYAYYNEIGNYLNNGAEAVVVYNHRCRKKEDVYFKELFINLEKSGLERCFMQAIVFPRFSIRDYIIISKDEETHERIRAVLEEMVRNEGKKPFCRLPKI